MVNQGEGNVVVAQQIIERWTEPILVAKFESESRLGRKFLKEWLQAIQKVHRAGKRIPVEVRKLHEDDGEFFTERFAGAKKLGHYGVRVHKNPFVSDFLRCFQSEKKIGRSFVIPAPHGGNGGNAIEGGVNFEGIKFEVVPPLVET